MNEKWMRMKHAGKHSPNNGTMLRDIEQHHGVHGRSGTVPPPESTAMMCMGNLNSGTEPSQVVCSFEGSEVYILTVNDRPTIRSVIISYEVRHILSN